MNQFTPTHIIAFRGLDHEVMLEDGVAYTRDEWDTDSTADFEVNDAGDWLFQGAPFTGEVIALTGAHVIIVYTYSAKVQA